MKIKNRSRKRSNLRSGSGFVSLWKLHLFSLALLSLRKNGGLLVVYIRAGKAVFLAVAVRENAWELLKLGLISGYKRSHKSAGIAVRRIRAFPFLPTPLTFRLWSSENQVVGIGSRSTRINQSRCTFSRVVICLVLTLLLPTLTIWFSLDHKRNLSGIEHTLCASDYDSDSDSVASEKQPFKIFRHSD